MMVFQIASMHITIFLVAWNRKQGLRQHISKVNFVMDILNCFNMLFSARLYPKMTKMSLKKIENSKLRGDGLDGLLGPFGLKTERRTRCTNSFCPKNTGNALISTFQGITSFSGSKTSKLVLGTEWVKHFHFPETHEGLKPKNSFL